MIVISPLNPRAFFLLYINDSHLISVMQPELCFLSHLEAFQILFITFFSIMQTKKLSCTVCLMTQSMAARKAVPASSLTKQNTKQPIVSGKRHTYSLNMVWTESSVPFCSKLSVHAQHKLLVRCIVRSFSTSLWVLYGYIKCRSRKKKLNLTTGRLRGWGVLNRCLKKKVSSLVPCLIY